MSNEKKLLSEQIPEIGRRLAKLSGKDLVNREGKEAILETVTSILCGGNVRALTERLTRKRILFSNASLFMTYLKGTKTFENFEEDLNSIVAREIQMDGLEARDKTFLQSLLGLTGKSKQNVLRGDEGAISEYLDEAADHLVNISNQLSDDFGDITASVQIEEESYSLNWLSFLQILYAVGAQTLALRGSEKSMYGKLFEKLILGSLLTILGFKKIDRKEDSETAQVFWLSHRSDKRESDATLLVKSGKGAQFDLGFIGPGNTEISLDKVSRFERQIEHGNKKHKSSTIVLVDRVGDRSRIKEMAKDIDGSIVEMSTNHWVKEVAQILKDKLGYESSILNMSNDKSIEFIKSEMEKMDLGIFIEL